MSRGTEIKNVDGKLLAAFGRGEYEQPLAGDLDCLWWQLGEFVRELEAMLASDRAPSGDDINPISLWHLLPHLQTEPTRA